MPPFKPVKTQAPPNPQDGSQVGANIEWVLGGLEWFSISPNHDKAVRTYGDGTRLYVYRLPMMVGDPTFKVSVRHGDSVKFDSDSLCDTDANELILHLQEDYVS